MKSTAFYTALFLLIFSSCVKEIDMDFPDAESKLTLSCILQPGEVIKAHLTSTVPFSQVNGSPYYRDGLITLYENGKLVDTLSVCEGRFRESQHDTAWIYCSSYPVTQGNTYLVKAVKAGFPEIHGTTTIPQKGKVIDIQSFDDDEFGEPFEIVVQDAGSGHHFYLLEIRSNDGTTQPLIADLASDDPTISLFSQIGVLQLPNEERIGTKAFFTDEYFSGNTKKIKVRASFAGIGEANEVLLYSVSKEYYDYVKTLAINRAVGESPFSEPLPVKTNVNNGFGLVGSVNVTTIRF